MVPGRGQVCAYRHAPVFDDRGSEPGMAYRRSCISNPPMPHIRRCAYQQWQEGRGQD